LLQIELFIKKERETIINCSICNPYKLPWC